MSVNIYTAAGLKKIAGSGFMDAELNENSNNGVKNKVLKEKLDEHDEAIEQINTDLSNNRFTLSVVSSAQTNFNGYGIYDKASKTVRIYVASNGTSVSSTEVALGIPTEYRPTVNAKGIGMVNGGITSEILVNTDGKVVQYQSGAYTSVLAIIEYSLV